ncbi:hypothetical protein FBUS_09943 [Fasciolopsis buskii]|uniref:Uncharacterized protein n=1 Tax=Fasciolopsis buskii TaxID=27845 RepID=A0A8E0RRB8_9TREM|nr:hypothetical protein FBUS_09943 [Fasciolopsis buski]
MESTTHKILVKPNLQSRLRHLSGPLSISDIFDTSVLQPFYQDLWVKLYTDRDLRNKAIEGTFLYDRHRPGQMEVVISESKSHKIYCQCRFQEICQQLGVVPLEFMCLHQNTFLRVATNRMCMTYSLYRQFFIDELVNTLELTIYCDVPLKSILYMSLIGLLVCSHPETEEALWRSILVPVEMHVQLKTACLRPLKALKMNYDTTKRYSALKICDSDSHTEYIIPGLGAFHPSEGIFQPGQERQICQKPQK